ncbi:carbohydrate binding family 9 domain-containing protein [Candidatus Fermentibacteria bacterium]|nr:carbohydrate binding family 9 domain-containing protein [Candidatus Fermentibacteria bacterium]
MISAFLVIMVAASTPCQISAVRVNQGPAIDGLLSDAVWDGARRESCVFTQYGPHFGQPMSEPTDIFALHDEQYLYFGFHMPDPDPSTMMDALTPRDSYVTGEWIAVLLDTYGDGRQATSFEVSLANSQMDSKLYPSGVWDYSWDAVWKSGTARVSNGWSAEMAIPFSCLRFDDTDSTVTWGVNFQRILSKNVENGWYVLTATRQMADLANFAPLNGLHGIQRALGAELRPYAAHRAFRHTALDSWDDGSEIGVDVKLGISTGVVADLTINPDFGQVEADAVEMNLSHFELFLGEKRPFFLEARNVFDMPFNMFYSRRVGSVAGNGEVIPIRGGAKLSGSFGSDWKFGFLDAVTGAVRSGADLAQPAANYGIFRTYRQFGSYGRLGVSCTSREMWEQEGRDRSFNRAAAVDGAVELNGRTVLSGAAARSWNSGRTDDGAYSIGLERLRGTFTYSLSGRHIGEDFDVNGTGFTTATGYRSGEGNAGLTLRPDRIFSEVGFGVSSRYMEGTDGAVTARTASLNSQASLKSGANIGVDVSYRGNRFDPYEGPSGHSYGDAADVFVQAGSNPFNPFTAWAGVGGGQYEAGGSFANVMARARLRPSAALDLGVQGQYFTTSGSENYNWTLGDYDTRSTEWKSLIVRANYLFSPALNLRLFSQLSAFDRTFDMTGSSTGSEVRTNLLFSWQYLPGSMLYLLAETQFQSDESGQFHKPNLGVYAKVTWFLPV